MGSLIAERQSEVLQASDVFAHVDESGFLNLIDKGGEDGLFGCKSENHYGVVRTSIEVGSPYADDYVLGETTELKWADGESASKNISIRIVKDRVADSEVWEDFQIYIYNPVGASVDQDRERVVIKIHDDDGPGHAIVSLNASYGRQVEGWNSLAPDPVAERGYCCGGNCAEAGDKPEEAKWCAVLAVSRSAARGDECMSFLRMLRAAQ